MEEEITKRDAEIEAMLKLQQKAKDQVTKEGTKVSKEISKIENERA